MVKALTLVAIVVTCVFGVVAEVPCEYYSVASNILRAVNDTMLYSSEQVIETGAMKMQRLIDEDGWTSNQVAEVLSYIVTNTSPGKKALGQGVIFDHAVSSLPDFAGDAAATILADYMDKADAYDVRQVAFQYARVSGFGHDAIARYGNIVFNPEVADEYAQSMRFFGIYDAFVKNEHTVIETNRFLSVLLKMDSINPRMLSAWGLDRTKCRMWPGYSTSSNRYLYVSELLPRCRPGNVSNYFNHAKLELEALPPGTMQMLSTNQFYNVEE